MEVRDENLVGEEVPDNDVVATRKRVSTAPAEEVVGANGEKKSDDDCEEDQSDHVGVVDTGGHLPPRRGGVMSDANMLKEAKRQREAARTRTPQAPDYVRGWHASPIHPPLPDGEAFKTAPQKHSGV